MSTSASDNHEDPGPHAHSAAADGHGIEDLDGIDTVILATDDSTDSSVTEALSRAVELARSAGAKLVFYDRSGETWGDTPHPSRLLSATADAVKERTHLTEQVQKARDAGVEVGVWLATIPSLSGVTGAVRDLSAQVVVVPTAVAGKLADRLLPGKGPVGGLKNLFDHTDAESVILVEVDDDGATTTKLAEAHEDRATPSD